jgi:hypothetical protein
MVERAIELFRCYENGALVEEEWITSLLASRQVLWRDDSGFGVVSPGAIYVIAGSDGMPAFPEAFLKAVSEQGDCGLIHLGDEFLRGDYRHYAAFAFVLRNYRASWLSTNKGVLTFPLGYPPNVGAPTNPKPASAREFLWCILGARNAARADLTRAWRRVPRGFVALPDTRAGEALMPRSKYLDVMKNAAFAPAPMGNVVTETWRFWEALELGAIPIAPRRLGFDYYTELLGPHPVPTFRTWAKAAAFVSRFEQDRVGLDTLQAEILSWWSSQKAVWSDRLITHIDRGRRGLFAQDMKAFEAFPQPKITIRRMAELLKHHDIVALRGRAEIAIRRMHDKIGGGGAPKRAAHPLDQGRAETVEK